ncbi:Cyclin-like [Sesbania bispinosa]|nr:Cyclin-like [Sesbania bispinosa]
MADQENCMPRPQRAAKKRAAAAICEMRKKKRVALGELTNLSTVVSPPEKPSSEVHKEKRRKVGKPKPTAAAAEKLDDAQTCGPYVSDIYEYLRGMEVDPSRRPLPDYVHKVQKDVNANMRGVLVDWLVEVAEEYKLVSDTLYFSVSYIDRYLSLNALSRQKLQLLGVSSMLIASKYEEIKPPEVEDFCYITDNTYSKEEVVAMEADILKSLNFELGGPTSISIFPGMLSHSMPVFAEDSLGWLKRVLMLRICNLSFLPTTWPSSNSALHLLTRYEPAELKECVLNIHDLYLSRRGGSLLAVREKYKQHKFKCVATTPSPPEITAFSFEFRGTDI